MRNIIISFLKNISIFDFVKRLYLKFDRVNRYYKRYETREFRVAYYRKLIDKYLKNKKSNNHKSFIAQLEKEINKRSKCLISIQPNWWLTFFRLVDFERGCKELDKYADILQNETSKLSFSQNSASALLEIYALLIEYGLYSVGSVIRSQCAQAVVQEGYDDKSSQKSLERFLSAVFEENDKDKINSILSLLKKISKDNTELLLLDLLLNKINNNHVVSEDVAIDKDYLSLIKGKRIAIVGPSQSSIRSGKEIDGFDLVIRFNYKGGSLSLSSKYIGSRTDISYLNGANTWDLENRQKDVPIRGLRAVVFKVPTNTNLSGYECARQMLLPLERCMLDNSPYALPNVISDLLIYQPLEIKIFNIDMFLTGERDSSYGVMSKEYWKESYPKAGHDPYSQYAYIQHLYNLGLINGDSVFNDIMDVGIIKYMRSLQSNYIHTALKCNRKP